MLYDEVVNIMNTAKDLLKQLIDELPETKAGQLIDYLLFLKNKEDQLLHLNKDEEEEIWKLIKNDERIPSDQVKQLIKGDS